MKTFERKGVTVSVFQGDEDLSTIHQLQDKFGLAGLEKNKLLFVSIKPNKGGVKNKNPRLIKSI